MHDRKQELIDLLSEECENLEDVHAQLKTLFKETLEKMLEAELNKHLGCEKEQRAR